MWLHMWGNHQNCFTYDSSRSSPASSASVPTAQAQAAQPSPTASRPRGGRGRPLPTQSHSEQFYELQGSRDRAPVQALDSVDDSDQVLPVFGPSRPICAICNSDTMIPRASSSSDLLAVVLFLFFYWVTCLLLIIDVLCIYTGCLSCLVYITTTTSEMLRVMCVCSIMSDSLQPNGLQPARLLSPWNFPGKNTTAGCHFLLQEMEPASLVSPASAGRFCTISASWEVLLRVKNIKILTNHQCCSYLALELSYRLSSQSCRLVGFA